MPRSLGESRSKLPESYAAVGVSISASRAGRVVKDGVVELAAGGDLLL